MKINNSYLVKYNVDSNIHTNIVIEYFEKINPVGNISPPAIHHRKFIRFPNLLKAIVELTNESLAHNSEIQIIDIKFEDTPTVTETIILEN